MAAGQVWAAAAHWLICLVGSFAGAHQSGWMLALWLLDLAAVRDSVACFAMCLSSELHSGAKSAIYYCLVIFALVPFCQ